MTLYVKKKIMEDIFNYIVGDLSRYVNPMNDKPTPKTKPKPDENQPITTQAWGYD